MTRDDIVGQFSREALADMAGPAARVSRHRLEAEFREVSRLYFPGWHGARTWAIRAARIGRLRTRGEGHWSEIGHCESETRTIFVLNRYATFGGCILRRLILHEVCHALGHDDHEAAWQSAFLQTERRARDLGDELLAEAIRRELAGWTTNVFRLSIDQILFDIRELVHSKPDASFNQVLNLVAYYYNEVPTTLPLSRADQRLAYERELASAPRPRLKPLAAEPSLWPDFTPASADTRIDTHPVT